MSQAPPPLLLSNMALIWRPRRYLRRCRFPPPRRNRLPVRTKAAARRRSSRPRSGWWVAGCPAASRRRGLAARPPPPGRRCRGAPVWGPGGGGPGRGTGEGRGRGGRRLGFGESELKAENESGREADVTRSLGAESGIVTDVYWIFKIKCKPLQNRNFFLV